ncbi:uncharacterized protein [Littorina saxatilis]|uniref:uncharacterized protein n=1 Tax=Littorina saxatilis TaxID=31220 RepID=UPI0038B46A48
MSRRASFAEISKSVTKAKPRKSDQLKRSSTALPGKLKRAFSKLSKLKETPKEEKESKSKTSEKSPDPEVVDNLGELTEEAGSETVTLGEGGAEREDNAEVVVLGEDPPPMEEEEDEEKEEEEEEQKAESEAQRRPGRPKRLTKKQRRLLEEKEEDQAREERRQRREARRRKKELQAELAEQAKPVSFDEAAYMETIYTMVKSSLALVMTQDNINITVDNLTPLMKSFDLDTGDEEVKELILEALLDTYGIVDPQKIDSLFQKKMMESDMDDLEECVDTAFTIIDQDRDGLISTNDLYRLMIHLGEVLWDGQVDAMMKVADQDCDGRLSKKDVFLFLLGQDKTVKLEDQILGRLANNVEEATTAGKHNADATATGDNSATASAGSAATSLTATLKVTEPSEESEASARRRKMFSGYAKLAVASRRLSVHGPTESNEADRQLKTPEPQELEENIDEEADEVTVDKEQVEPDTDQTDNQGTSEELSAEVFHLLDEDNEHAPPAPQVRVACSEWSDSGHEGSDRDDDTCGDESDEELQFACAPMALDADLAYLPAPEFNMVASPLSPRTPRSRLSSLSLTPRSRSRETWRNDSPQNSEAALLALNQDFNRKVTPDLDLDPGEGMVTARTERTSEYDSDRDGDEDENSLPETSQQNHILREVEKQVLPMKEALAAKCPNIEGVALKERFAAMITRDPDGCESVVRSEIHPTYVPTCAREARRGMRLPDIPDSRRESLGDLSVLERSKYRLEKDHQDLLIVEDYATSTAEILSKGYVSLSSPRSDSNSSGQTPLNYFNDDVLSPEHDAVGGFQNGSSFGLSQGFGFQHLKQARELDEDGMGLRNKAEEEIVEQEGEEQEELDEDNVSSSFCGEGVVVQGFSNAMHMTRKLSARSRPHAPLRRSLTCHQVTVKDLTINIPKSQSTGRTRRALLTRSNTLRHNSFSPVRRDTTYERRDSPLSRNDSFYVRESSGSLLGRKDSSFSRQDSFASKRESSGSLLSRKDSFFVNKRESSGSPLSRKDSFLNKKYSCVSVRESSGSPLMRRTQSFHPGRPSSMGRTESPLSRGDSSANRRVYSPIGRADSFRSQIIESSRTNQDSSRSNWESAYIDSVRSQRDSSRSQKESWRSSRESHRSRREMYRGRTDALTARSEQRTDRSYYDEDNEELQEPEEEFRFNGPNFDFIMNQKGEPEELLQESLYRDSVVRAGLGRRDTSNDLQLTAKDEPSISSGQGRKTIISRQLERVKEMEARILQRRVNLSNDSGEDSDFLEENSSAKPLADRDQRHSLRRSQTTMHLKSSRRDPSGYTSADHSPFDQCHRSRPKSCIAGRRRGAPAFDTKVVSILDDGEVHVSARGNPTTSTTHGSSGRISSAPLTRSPGRNPRNQPQPKAEPKVHVVDLSSLLSKVNEPENQEDSQESSGYGKNGRKFKPLARMLVAYENARRRQAANAVGSNAAGAATSISRLLEQGIPYTPPSPPRESSHVDFSPRESSHVDFSSRESSHVDFSPRKYHRNQSLREHVPTNEIEVVSNAQSRFYSQHSASNALGHPSAPVLGSERGHGLKGDETNPLLEAFFAHGQRDDNDDISKMMSLAERADMKSSVTFGFPERSV